MEQPATTAAATNKLFHAAKFDLPDAGRWDVEVLVDGPDGTIVVRCEVDVAGPLPRLVEVWPWIAWPFAVVGLFAIHLFRVRRGSERRTNS